MMNRHIRHALMLSVAGLSSRAALAAPPTDLPVVQRPEIPDRTFNIRDFGAVEGGSVLNTEAIRSAIAACEKAGGGVVVVPPGRYLTAAFAFKSRINLRLEKGATLLLSNRFADYRLDPRRGYENQITADSCHDIAITGEGVIDGQGQPWWTEFLKTKNAPEGVAKFPHRPYMVTFKNCNRVLVEGVTMTHSPSFHFVPQACSDVTIHKLTILAPENAPNTDGIDPSGWNYIITECVIDTGDDNIAIKPAGKPGEKPSCMNIYIADCTFKHGHGLSIGGQTPGGLKRLVVRNCSFSGTTAGIRMKASRGSGGLVEDCIYENITMDDVKYPIYISSYYPERGTPKTAASDETRSVETTTPIWRNIRIRNLTAVNCPNAGRMIGVPEMPISDVELENVRISAQKGFQIWNARNIRFIQSSVAAEKGPAFDLQQTADIALP